MPVWDLGGMGTVYRARDERLHRTVAIKVVGAPDGTGSTSEDRGRLLDEARAASHLNHPHICTVYEVGEADGRAFIAMDNVGGRPLSESLPVDGLPAETVVRFGVQIAGALAHAHERGVIHRDLKTANVVVAEEHGVKVLDFGLARRIDTAAQEDATRTVEESTESGRSSAQSRTSRPSCSRPAGPREVGHLGTRRGALRDGNRGAPVPRPQQVRVDRRDSAIAAASLSAARAADAPRDHLSMPDQGARATLPARR